MTTQQESQEAGERIPTATMETPKKNFHNLYVNDFFKLNCYDDILRVVQPVSAGLKKEISEAWAVVRQLKPMVMQYKNEFTVLDLCAGNALGSIISVFLLPIKKAQAFDVHRPDRNYSGIERFYYEMGNIYGNADYLLRKINNKTIIIAIHPCTELAEQIIKIYNESQAHALIMMPCCNASGTKIQYRNFLQHHLGKYLTWAYYLGSKIPEDKHETKIIVDRHCLSPKNAIIIAKRRS